jgi:adenine-specific DNA-methyltransferase
VTLYFSAGYYSTYQAIELDSLRWAIEQMPKRYRLASLAAWLLAAARMLNGPGHTAQHLRPTSEAAYQRMRRVFRRSAYDTFFASLTDLQPLGTPQWRAKSRVFNAEAHELLRSIDPAQIAVVYADPPYTRDQYSRFYHVYETLCRYDYPGAKGRGRVHDAPRPKSRYSRASTVVEAFIEFFELMKRIAKPLVLSYPSHGLLHTRGSSPLRLAEPWFRLESHVTLNHVHSTLGASKGSSRNPVVEHIYSFVPR